MPFASIHNTTLRSLGILAAAAIVSIPVLQGEESKNQGKNEGKRGLFDRIFSGEEKQDEPGPEYDRLLQDAYVDRETDTISRLVGDESKTVGERENDPVNRYPEIPGYETIKSKSQKEIDKLIEAVYAAYEVRIDRMDPPDLRSARLLAMGSVPNQFPTVWEERVDNQVWGDQQSISRTVEDIYRRTLQHSNQVKVMRDLPLIRETGMQEADGEFDPEAFIEGRNMSRNEPIGSTLTTGNNANRFLENENFMEGGLRKKFSTGAEMTLSNRFSTLSNNSTFLVPQNQGSSEMVLSIVQPLLDGGGYHYNQSKIKLAKFDARMASAEFVRQLQSHLIEVNRAYWALYYARSYYLLTKDLVDETRDILQQLEQRSDLDALQSEVLRARSSLEMRKSMLNRAEMAIRNSEEQLRALVNDPEQDIGSNAEMIPATPPITSRYVDSVREVATDALRNRPEIRQGFDELRAAIVRRDMSKKEKLPTLNLVAEMMLGDIEPNDATGRAFEDQFGDGTGYVLGFEFSQPLGNDEARAKLLRSEIELRQQANRLKATVDRVLLEAVVSYRELMTAYRDMQGRYSALRASREELRQLRDRLEVDTEQEGGRTTASQLQLILDSMDRNQQAEEMFLDSVVAYNAAFAALERARGTFLRSEKVEIDRVKDTGSTHPNKEVERLDITKNGRGASSSARYPDVDLPSSDDPIPDVPEQAQRKKSGRGGLFSFARQDDDEASTLESGFGSSMLDDTLFAQQAPPKPSADVVPLNYSPSGMAGSSTPASHSVPDVPPASEPAPSESQRPSAEAAPRIADESTAPTPQPSVSSSPASESSGADEAGQEGSVAIGAGESGGSLERTVRIKPSASVRPAGD